MSLVFSPLTLTLLAGVLINVVAFTLAARELFRYACGGRGGGGGEISETEHESEEKEKEGQHERKRRRKRGMMVVCSVAPY